MLPIENLTPNRVFYYFEQLSAIPHGSGDMQKIAQYCVDFATNHNLKCVRDAANNVIIFKNGTVGYENSDPIILQGHLDMVCQKTTDCNIDFAKDGLNLYIDGDFIKAQGTTLGADNGIAVAMVLAILESGDLAHPPIEAIFTTDEEIGMIGARALDASLLKSTRMINLDSEAEGVVTVSCAGGSDFVVDAPVTTAQKQGTLITFEINGLKGGHSGIEINQNRINANMLAGRILQELSDVAQFDIVDINGGDKSNAIPNRCVINLCSNQADQVYLLLNNITQTIKQEICDKEPLFNTSITVKNTGEYYAFTTALKEKIIYTLLCAPCGIVEMSATVNGLVETSLNLGILKTNKNSITMHFALRSNKMSALYFLEKRLAKFFNVLDLPFTTFGHYPAWQYRENSPLRTAFCTVHQEMFGKSANVEAIHAGLECGVFAGKINNFDCISFGPTMHDVHTTREKLSISSTANIYALLTKILSSLK